jgi:hypothetical protein
MSDIPAGIKTKTPLIEESMADLAKFMKQMTGFLGVLYEAGGGDKNKAKKISTSLEDYFTRQRKKDVLEAKYGKNFDELLRIVKVISKDTKYQSEQAKLNREAGEATRKLQDKYAAGNVLDQMSKNSPWLRALTGRHPNLPGSARERQHDLQDKINYAYAGKAQEQGNDPYQKMKAGGLQLKEGGIVNGPGRTVVTEGDVAKLPFGISGPAALLHLDLKKLIGQKGEGNEFEGLVKKGGGGGLISSLAGMLPGILGAAIPLLIMSGVAAALIAMIANERGKRDNQNNNDYNNLSPVDKDKADSANTLKPEYKNGDVNNLLPSAKGSQKEKEKSAKELLTIGSRDNLIVSAKDRSIALETLGLFTKGRRKVKNGGLFGVPTIELDSGYKVAIGSLSEEDKLKLIQTSGIEGTDTSKNGLWMKNAEKLSSFDSGGQAGKAILHKGELVATKEESDDIRKLIDMASGNKPNPANKELVDLLKKQNDMIDKLLTETTKGNDILTNKEFKGGEEAKTTPIPIAKTKVNS